MNRRSLTVLFAGLVLIGSGTAALSWSRSHQKLGLPGIKTSPIPGSPRLSIYLPEKVLEYNSEVIPTDKNVLTYMPQDSSFGQRQYFRPGHNQLDPIALGVVLMGTDRTSIHRPEFCLVGAGWVLDESKSQPATVPILAPYRYDLPVMKLLSTMEYMENGHPVTLRRVYTYWFVADQKLTADHNVRMWEMSKGLLRTGVLQRWAYIMCNAVCRPGEEDATFERMKGFIQAAVPQFQLVTGPRVEAGTATRLAAQ